MLGSAVIGPRIIGCCVERSNLSEPLHYSIRIRFFTYSWI